MNVRYSWTDDEIMQRFEVLAGVLAGSDGEIPIREYTWTSVDYAENPKRRASADEFMLMDERDDSGQRTLSFKHYATRNYLFLTKSHADPWRLLIPRSIEPWRRGGFGPAPEALEAD